MNEQIVSKQRLASQSIQLIASSERLEQGKIYTRAQLSKLFSVPSSGPINNGVFRPDRKRYRSIWLFVTQDKSADRPQFIDKLEGDNLHWQGQSEQGTDKLIINHSKNDLEILLFYRKKRNTYPHGGFCYEGTFDYVSHDQASKPTDFRLRRTDQVLDMSKRDIEAEIEQDYREGQQRQVLTNRYERDPKARAAAVKFHGKTCVACGFSFGLFYGEHGEGFIQVHHIKPIASYGGHVEINPVTDMTVLCSNCHSMVHRIPKQPLSIEELKKIIKHARVPRT